MEIAQKCTRVLLAHGKIRKDQQAIYLYGFELLFSTVFCIACMLLLGISSGYPKATIVFLLYFFPIRIVAGGYHAKSYRNCFFLTNSIAIVCVAVSETLWRWQNGVAENFLLLGLMAAVVVIWRQAPVIPRKYIHKTSRYNVNRRYSHIILGMELVILLLNYFFSDHRMLYTAVITTYSVAIMIEIARRGDV